MTTIEYLDVAGQCRSCGRTTRRHDRDLDGYVCFRCCACPQCSNTDDDDDGVTA